MRATTLETCAIPHARPCRAASGCTRHDANKTHAVATLQRRAREDMIVQAEPNTMLPELEFEREHRVKMITFHPLSLMFLAEAITCQRLRQDVSQLLLSADVLNVHCPVANALSNEMIFHIYMLASIVKNRILTESDC